MCVAAKFSRRRAAQARPPFLRGESGAAAVEFALVAPPFLALLIGILQGLVVFFAQRQLDETVAKSSRAILTGKSSALSVAQFQPLLCRNTAALFDCNQYMINIQSYASYAAANSAPPTLTFDAQGRISNGWAFDIGKPGDIVVLQVMYPWPVVLAPLGASFADIANGQRLLVSTYVFKREPV